MDYNQAKMIIWNWETYPTEKAREAVIFVLGTLDAYPEDVTQAAHVFSAIDDRGPTNQGSPSVAVTNRPDVGEVNGLVDGRAYHNERHAQGQIDKVYWTEPGLRITRLRLLSDPGYPAWDVSYCHGILDGQHVDVELPFSDLPKRNYKAAIIQYAKKDKVFAKGLGVFDAISTLN